MQTVPKEQLTEYRNPTETEKRQIVCYMAWKTKSELRPMKLWLAICILFTVCALITVFSGDNENTGTLIVTIVFLISAGIASLWMFRSISEKKKLLSEIKSGHYAIMDCQLYDVQHSTEMTGKAAVWVVNRNGERCTDKFFTDTKSALDWQNGKRRSFILVRCGNTYELISEYRMTLY